MRGQECTTSIHADTEMKPMSYQDLLNNPAIKLICAFDQNGNLITVIDPDDPKRNTVVKPSETVPLDELVGGPTESLRIHKIESFQVMVTESSPKKITVHMRGICIPPI